MQKFNYLFIVLAIASFTVIGCQQQPAAEAPTVDQTLVEQIDRLIAEADQLQKDHSRYLTQVGMPDAESAMDRKSPFVRATMGIGQLWSIRTTLEGIKEYHQGGHLPAAKAQESLQKLRSDFELCAGRLKEMQESSTR